jgi:hypothetical protein
MEIIMQVFKCFQVQLSYTGSIIRILLKKYEMITVLEKKLALLKLTGGSNSLKKYSKGEVFFL